MKLNIHWFKERFFLANGYTVTYSFFENGDFGDLDRVEIEGNGKEGYVDFWSLGWLNIHIVDCRTGLELMNVLLEPHEEKEKAATFTKLQQLLLL